MTKPDPMKYPVAVVFCRALQSRRLAGHMGIDDGDLFEKAYVVGDFRVCLGGHARLHRDRSGEFSFDS
jgi:hypothetical protein